MPFPTSTVTVTDAQLSAVYELSLQDNADMFVGSRVLPVINVAQQSGQFGVLPIEELLKNDGNLERAPGSGYKRDSHGFEIQTYATREYGIEEVVDQRTTRIYSSFYDALMFAAVRAAHRVQMAAEKRVAALVMDYATYTGNANYNTSLGNGKWDTAGGTPVTDLDKSAREIYTQTGLWPNTLIINRLVFRALRFNPQVVAAIQSAGAGDQTRQRDVTAAQLAAVFDVDQVLVAGGTQNTALPSQAAAISQIWGNHAMLCVTARTGDIEEPCIGRQFHYGADGSMPDGLIERYFENDRRSYIIRARHEADEKRLYIPMGNMIPDVLT